MYCPTDVLKVVDGKITVTDIDGCVGCFNCELSCPDFVLEVVEEDDK
jgi:NAD-dependent dihydropyrimidine dehydrogenase PreA subunit